MKRYIQIVSIFSALMISSLLGTFQLFAQDDAIELGNKKALEAIKQNENSMGRYFMVVLPPNENRNHPAQIAAIFVAASEVTKVQLVSPQGTRITKICQPYKTVVFSSLDSKDLFSWDSEIWETELIGQKGWFIEAEKPVSVYVINSKSVSTDGYLAIPVAQWGKDYIHNSFWDFKEFDQWDWAGGFVVMAVEDNTKINIQLNGRGRGVAKTRQGRNIGDRIQIKLMKGETYSVSGDGKTRGGFDLSGSRITGDKPIGVVSYHHRCMIPVHVVSTGRDHMCEAMPPIKSWGRRYVTVELDRGSDMGDFFRVVAAEDNTTVTVKWYDRSNKKLIGNHDVQLKKAGDYYEFYQTGGNWPTNKDFPSVRGTSVWESDKQFLLMQYSFSANWDGNGKFDPSMFLVTPTEQYTKSTIFQTPRNFSGTNEYTENYFNLVAIGDTANPKRNQELIESITLDGVKVSDLTSGFTLNNIPGTDQYWTRIPVTPGPHYIYGDTPFGGYIYGFASFDSYSWPAATAYRTVGEVDTLCPVPTPTGECGVYEVKVTELRNGQVTDTPRQVETGVGAEPAFTEKSFNFDKITYDKPNVPAWVPYPTQTDFKLYTKVIDKYADAYGEIKLVDDANNDTLVVLRYEADSIKIDPEVIDFKEVRVGSTSDELIVKVQSHSDSIITIKEIKLQKGLVFKIAKSLQAGNDGKVVLMPREVKEITLTYTPTQEFQDINPEKMDLDSLLITTNCLEFAWPVIGKGVIPKIKVSDFNAGIVGVNQKRCVTATAQGIMVENIGSMDLVVTGVDLTPAEQLPFVMSDQATINIKFPFTLKPAERIFLKDVCFEPKVSDLGQGKITRNVPFISNAAGNLPGEKPISIWEGTPVQPLVTITGLQYPRVRRLSVNKTNGIDNETNTATGIVRVYNTGTQVVTIKDVKLATNNPNFTLDYANMKPRNISVAGTTIELFPQSQSGNLVKVIEVPVIFNPQVVGDMNVEVIAEFDDNGNANQAGNILSGSAFEPMVELTNYTFVKNTIVGRDHTEGDGSVTKGIVEIQNITNNGVEADLEVTNINITGDITDFTLLNKPNFPLVIAPNSNYNLEFTFKPTNTGSRNIKVNVLSDAGPSKEATGGVRDPKDYPYTGANGLVDGIGINVGGGVVGFDLGNVLTCDNPVGEVVFTNTSTTDVLRINSITPDPTSDLTSFELVDALPTEIPINSQVKVRYRYLADKLGPVTAIYNVDFDDPEVLDGPYTLKANGYKHNVKFALDNFVSDVQLGKPLTYPIKISIDNSLANNDWADAGISKFTVDFRYQTSWLTVIKDGNNVYNMSKGTSLQGNWKLTGSEIVDPNNPKFTLFRIVGENLDATKGYVDGNGTLVNLAIRVFLADTANYKPQIDVTNIEFVGEDGNIRNKCITAEGAEGQIAYTTCVQSVRGLILGEAYKLEGPDSKIVNGNSIDLKFNVAFEAPTKLELIDITGAVVSVPFDSVLKGGAYEANISTDALSNGQYFVRYSSGPFSETINFIIQK